MRTEAKIRTDTPKRIRSVEHLEDMLSTPTPALNEVLSRIPGDILILGAGGKIGPSISAMAKRSSDETGTPRRIIAVSRFSNRSEQDKLDRIGIETIRGNLLDPSLLQSLPDAENVIYLAGMKFGASGNESLVWALNVHLPALICNRFPKSRIAAYSTGNVYGMTPIIEGGPKETASLNPAGEYSMSCLGRERMFEHFSRANNTDVVILRLNYAIEMRYGVFLDIANRISSDRPINLTMSAVNVIWQGDANDMCLRSLEHASHPATVLNIGGAEILNVRRIAQQLGILLDKKPIFEGQETPDALLSNSSKAHSLFGSPPTTPDHMLRWVADWIRNGGTTHGKPTHFEVRNGIY